MGPKKKQEVKETENTISRQRCEWSAGRNTKLIFEIITDVNTIIQETLSGDEMRPLLVKPSHFSNEI